MNAFADTNWLEALYFDPDPKNAHAVARAKTVERRSRKESILLVSPIVLLEARNVFSRTSGQSKPGEWDDLIADFHSRIYVDPMNWDLLRRETDGLFERFSHRAVIGTLDASIIASAILAGAREFLSFDERAKALAVAMGISVFPTLNDEGRAFLDRLRDR